MQTEIIMLNILWTILMRLIVVRGITSCKVTQGALEKHFAFGDQLFLVVTILQKEVTRRRLLKNLGLEHCD